MPLLWLNPSAYDLPQHIDSKCKLFIKAYEAPKVWPPRPALLVPCQLFPRCPGRVPALSLVVNTPALALAAPWCHAWAVLLSLSSSVVQGCPRRARHLRHSSAWKVESHFPHPFRHAVRHTVESYHVSLGHIEAASIWADCCLCWGPISLWLP